MDMSKELCSSCVAWWVRVFVFFHGYQHVQRDKKTTLSFINKGSICVNGFKTETKELSLN